MSFGEFTAWNHSLKSSTVLGSQSRTFKAVPQSLSRGQAPWNTCVGTILLTSIYVFLWVENVRYRNVTQYERGPAALTVALHLRAVCAAHTQPFLVCFGVSIISRDTQSRPIHILCLYACTRLAFSKLIFESMYHRLNVVEIYLKAFFIIMKI